MFASLFLIAGVAHAASFNCAKATTPQEKTICASPELSAADEKLAAAYRADLAAAPPDQRQALRTEQRAWLGKVADQCKTAAPASSTKLAQCLLGLYRVRTQELRERDKNRDRFVTRSLTLTYPDSPGDGSSDGEENPGFGTLKATWPESTDSSADWRAWNRAIQAAAQSMAAKGNSGGSSGEWLKEWAADGDFEVAATVEFVGDELVTASIGIEGMGHHAAHPSEDGIEFNWLLKEEREVRPEDVFRKDSGWEQVIEDICSKELQKEPDSLYDDWRGPLRQVILNSRNWELGRAGLTIDFPEYTVSPRVSPVEPVMIPWTELKPLLRASFPVPQ